MYHFVRATIFRRIDGTGSRISPWVPSKKTNVTPLVAPILSNESSENSIDSSQYYVGSGDVFLVSILAMSNRQFKAVIDDNGGIVLPDFGLVKLGKVPLQAAKSMIRDHVSQKNKNKKRRLCLAY